VLQEVVWEVRNKLRGKGKFKKNNVNVKIVVIWVYIVQNIYYIDGKIGLMFWCKMLCYSIYILF
jgi:hypothetical protein